MQTWFKRLPKNLTQKTCKHKVVTAQVEYDCIYGYTLIALRCIECGAVRSLTIYKTQKGNRTT